MKHLKSMLLNYVFQTTWERAWICCGRRSPKWQVEFPSNTSHSHCGICFLFCLCCFWSNWPFDFFSLNTALFPLQRERLSVYQSEYLQIILFLKFLGKEWPWGKKYCISFGDNLYLACEVKLQRNSTMKCQVRWIQKPDWCIVLNVTVAASIIK